MRRHAGALAVALTILASGSPVEAEAPPDAEVVIEGKGWGHGVGMPQDGALAMGLAGAGAAEILDAFYPGTSLGRRGGTVRVDLLQAAQSSVVVSLPGGGEVQGSGRGFPISVSPGGSVRLSAAGGIHRALPLDGATAAPEPAAPPPAAPEELAAPAPTTTTTVPSLLGIIRLPPSTPPPGAAPPTTPAPAPPPAAEPSEPASEGPLRAVPAGGSVVEVSGIGRYRGTIQAIAQGAGLQLVNELDVEQYLRGMGEVLDPGWPAAALQAQAIVARTYALDAMAAGGGLCSTQQCQVYLGETAEYGAMNAAVAATAGQVLTYGGSLAEAVYSANGGGISATPEEGFGRTEGDYPYLRAAPYPTNDPMPWDLRLPLADLGSRLGYPGQPSDVNVSRAGPSGRALEVTITGDAGPQAVEGQRFAETLGLRSTLFTVTVSAAGEPAVRSPDRAGHRHRRSYALAAGGADTELGRLPWTALSLLLLAAWGTAAQFCWATGRYSRRR